MNFRKVTSTIAALALSCASFAGLTLTAEAAGSVYNDAFTSGSASYTWSGNADKAVQSDAANSNAKGGSSYRIQGASNGRQRPAWSDVSSNALAGVIRVNLNLRMDSSYNSTSSTQTFKLLSATPTDANNDTTGKSILEFASTTADSGYSSSYKFNGTAIDSLDQGKDYSNAARNSSGWLNFDVLLNTNTQKFDITIKRITNNNSGDTYTLGETVYSATNVSFMNDVSAFKSIFVFTARYPSYNGGQTWLDDISVKQLSMPSLTLDKDATTIATGGNDTIGGTVTLGTAGDSVLTTASSDNNDVSVIVTNETTTSPTITVTSTGNTNTTATITVTTKTTGANADVGETVSKDIAVAVGALSYADVTVEYKDSSGNTLKSPTTVEDQIVNMPYTVTSDLTGNFDYTNPTTGVQYTASLNSNSPTSVASVAAEGSTLTLIFDLTEWKYSATVNTNPNTTVTISGTSTSEETVSETVVSSYTGVATFTSSLYAGTYTVIASKSGYTTNTSQSITVNTSGTATATVPALEPSTEGVVFYEDFGNGSNLEFTNAYTRRWQNSRYQVTSAPSNTEVVTDTLLISDATYDKYTITLENVNIYSNYDNGTGTASADIMLRNGSTNFAGLRVSHGYNSDTSTKDVYLFSGFVAANETVDIKNSSDNYGELTGNFVVEIERETGNFTASFAGNNVYEGTIENFDINDLRIKFGVRSVSFPAVEKITITGENYPAVATVTVTDGNNNSAPLSGATVTVGNYTATETSTPGTYTVSVPYDTTTGSSTYEVSVSKSGYASNTGSVTVTDEGGSTTVALTAQYTVTYSVSLPDADCSYSGELSETVLSGGTPASVPTITDNLAVGGHTFLGWSETSGGSIYVTPSSQTITADITYYAVFSDTITASKKFYASADSNVIAGSKISDYENGFYTGNDEICLYSGQNRGFISFDDLDTTNAVGATMNVYITNTPTDKARTYSMAFARTKTADWRGYTADLINSAKGWQDNIGSSSTTIATVTYDGTKSSMVTGWQSGRFTDISDMDKLYVNGSLGADVRFSSVEGAHPEYIEIFYTGNTVHCISDNISADSITPAEGATVTISPVSGYKLAGVPVVTKRDGTGIVTPSAGETAGTYTFTMPSCGVTVDDFTYSIPAEVSYNSDTENNAYYNETTNTVGDGYYARGFTFSVFSSEMTMSKVAVSVAGSKNADNVGEIEDIGTKITGATASADHSYVNLPSISGEAIFGLMIWTHDSSKQSAIDEFEPATGVTVTIN